MRGPCRKNLQYLWKRAGRIAGKPHDNCRIYNYHRVSPQFFFHGWIKKNPRKSVKHSWYILDPIPNCIFWFLAAFVSWSKFEWGKIEQLYSFCLKSFHTNIILQIYIIFPIQIRCAHWHMRQVLAFMKHISHSSLLYILR